MALALLLSPDFKCSKADVEEISSLVWLTVLSRSMGPGLSSFLSSSSANLSGILANNLLWNLVSVCRNGQIVLVLQPTNL